MKPVILILAALSLQLFAEPTGERDCHSTAGTTIRAVAVAVEEGNVKLKTANGRELTVPLDKFADEDREVLTTHFGLEDTNASPGEPAASGSEFVSEGLALPVGEVSGPIDAGEGSHYFAYIPKTLRQGRKAPLMFYTDASGGGAGTVEHLAKGAEVNGWIIAASVESRNTSGPNDGNHQHAKRCVEHLLSTLPIDAERVYFSGNSGGGAMSFYNALRIKSAGNMFFVGYSPDRKFKKGQYCVGIGGTTDFNRYITAWAVKEFGDKGIHRMVVDGHGNGPAWMAHEGMTWLNGRYLGDKRKDTALDKERLDFEASLIAWIGEFREATPYRAHYWCDFLKNEYGIDGENAKVVDGIFAELNNDPMNARYTAGIAALDEFSERYYADEGRNGGSLMEHTSARIERAAAELAEEYAGVPEIEDIAKTLGDKTETP